MVSLLYREWNVLSVNVGNRADATYLFFDSSVYRAGLSLLRPYIHFLLLCLCFLAVQFSVRYEISVSSQKGKGEVLGQKILCIIMHASA